MDTVEELNNTYFYKGISNLSAGELFFWILIDEVNDLLGCITNLTGIAAVLSGQPVLNTRGKPITATRGTSVASVTARHYLNIELPFRLPTFTNASIRKLKPMMVNNLGAFVGRSVPVLGWALVASDVAVISFRATTKYNAIARGKDKIW
ncbi:STM2901 family protein [Erwinia psidii]|uniref:Phage membrane protein n=1 Tax=Erwinia psidii TaxID=69224 RepID=A0A3N6UWS4_9GAMM|nr:hypothetical protein [Erwinia psidii]RQM37305.1 hypothetical protein EB241_15145 [Erwinia psidii]